MKADLRIGLAGWSYPDWRGSFYPAEAGSGFSELRYAADRFDCLEINSTFYRLPNASHTERWGRTVEDLANFDFTAKLTRTFTHEDNDAATIRAMSREFREGLAPLVERGLLGCVVVQFPWYFDDTEAHRARISNIAESLSPLPIAVELRHRSFLGSDDAGGLPFLGALGANFVNIDLPRAKESPPPTCINTGAIGYLRLHGRNARNWFRRHAGRDEKYDYLYSEAELADLFPMIERLAGRSRTVYVVTNNHFGGQAPANAQQLMHLAGREIVESPTLTGTFPFLERLTQERAS